MAEQAANLAPVKTGPLRQLPPSKMCLAEFAFNTFAVKVPNDTRIDQVMDERFWAHVALQFKPDDIIVVQPENRQWRLELIVVSSGKLYTQVRKINFVDFGEVVVRKEPVNYTVEYGGGSAKWRVLNGEVEVKNGFDSKRDAERWIESHEGAMTR